MTSRPTASTITDPQLDELYAQRDRARDALRHLMRYLPNHAETDEQHVDRTPPAAVRQLVDALAEALPEFDPAEERDFVWRQYQRTHRILSRRVGRAEAAIERVRKVQPDERPVYGDLSQGYRNGWNECLTAIHATLDDTEQSKEQHPFTCPGPKKD
ncbi:hypothetical protein [Streptomyces sp. NPDC004721]